MILGPHITYFLLKILLKYNFQIIKKLILKIQKVAKYGILHSSQKVLLSAIVIYTKGIKNQAFRCFFCYADCKF